MMKIAIFTNNYLPNPYGVSGSIESFRKELEKRGNTVYVFAPKFKGYADENPNVHRYASMDFKFRGIRFPIGIPFSFKIHKILKDLEIDVIHAQHPNLLGWEARRWAKKKNVPLVFTWHTLYDKYAHFFPLIPEKISAWWTIRNAVKYANKADQVVVPTPSVKKIIQNWGVCNPNIVAVATGVETDLFGEAQREEFRKKYDIAGDEIALLLLSRLTAEKNVQFLVRAIVKVLRKNAKAKFILAGEGDELAKLKEIIQKGGVEKQVIHQGVIPKELTKNIYAAGDVFVYASRSETQGMVISEAMYAGLPIVAVLASGIRDLVMNQVSGLLVKDNEDAFASAVQKLIDDKALRMKFSENARKIAHAHYTSFVCAQKMAAAYEEAIRRKTSKS